ncbi:hypothetical protein HY407_05135 [Candidatus Gottesmanbacteria bacterium]|nr:hypothetical protein [Candidatus Gottesmanbacteria bacterium]
MNAEIDSLKQRRQETNDRVYGEILGREVVNNLFLASNKSKYLSLAAQKFMHKVQPLLGESSSIPEVQAVFMTGVQNEIAMRFKPPTQQATPAPTP